MKKITTLALICIALASCSSNKKSQSTWPDADVAAFRTECVKGAAVSMSEDIANQYCDCMLQKIMTKYPDVNNASSMTIDEMTELAQDCVK